MADQEPEKKAPPPGRRPRAWRIVALSLFFLLLHASGSPLFLGQDTRQRPEFSLNVGCMLQNTQRIPE